MKRSRWRLSLLTTIRVSIGMVLFAVLWEKMNGKNDFTSGVAFVGLLVFLVAEAWFSGEADLAVGAVNARVDGELLRNDRQDDRIASLASEVDHLAGRRIGERT